MKFGVREIVDVVFKATANGQRIGDKTFKKYQPVFKIDTAQTSSLEQATTTVYAQGGKGYARLIAWEGEKTMTFTVTDALMSPMGLAVLTGAGLIKPDKQKQTHFHLALNGTVTDTEGTVEIDFDDIRNELGLADATSIDICNTIEIFGTKLDGSGAGIGWFNACKVYGYDPEAPGASDYTTVDATHKAKFTIADSDGTTTTPAAEGDTIQVDFYVLMNNSVTEVHIEPESFGGYFYVEAATLYRREDTGKDMAAELIIPKAKVQSAFTFTMAASGDPSTFDFVMDAMPGYTRFDPTTKKMCVIQIVGTDDAAAGESAHEHKDQDTNDTPSFNPAAPVEPEFNTTVGVVSATAAALTDDMKANQAKASVNRTSGDRADNITVTIAEGIDSLNNVEPKTGWGNEKWVALDYNTGESTIEGISYINRGTTTVLGADDIADATALGLGAGHMVVWVKADVAKENPATFRLEKDEKAIDVTIVAEDGI